MAVSGNNTVLNALSKEVEPPRGMTDREIRVWATYMQDYGNGHFVPTDAANLLIYIRLSYRLERMAADEDSKIAEVNSLTASVAKLQIALRVGPSQRMSQRTAETRGRKPASAKQNDAHDDGKSVTSSWRDRLNTSVN